MKAFITGSHAYGMPTNDSDIDLVVLMSEKTVEKLHELTGSSVAQDLSGWDWKLSLKFGNLNLLCCTDEEQYNIWKQGTRELKKRKPVTRDEAVKTFQRLRKEATNGNLQKTQTDKAK
jgi:predicted nucleotidyltransferase